ncbi:MAG TPA: hypothetical protein VM936_02730 [Pyrinomonadaceae bacterium]|nr:hypothetical protein [Pyrinomonadaceae bacterium]
MKKIQVKLALLSAAYVLLALSAARPCRAQSADVNFPTPVFSAEVSGRIAARDVGDARRTRHFYTFRGTEGDVTVTVEASELIGDVDVFTATTLRPLIKFTLFGDATRVTKSFYVRSEETLVLRVEARASGDSEGTYRVAFGGSFAPAPASLANVEEPKTPTLSESTRGPGTRRVTTAGARIEEPKPEPTPTPVEEARAPEPRPTPAPARNTTRRGGRSTRNSPRARTTPAPRPKPSGAETADAARPANDADAETPAANEPKPAETPSRPAPRRRNTRGSRGRASADRPAADAQPSGGGEPASPAPAAATGRLVIITLDGEIFERQMNAVRSVTVEKGQLVVTTLDGKTTRRPMSNVLRMSIEP